MINIFKANQMHFTAFDKKESIEYFKRQGIFLLSQPEKAHIIVSERINHLNQYIRLYGKNKSYLTWTREPRYNQHFSRIKKGFLWKPDIHVMNVYTGDVFVNNYYENSYRLVIDRHLELFSKENFLDFKTKKIAFLATNQKGNTSLKKEGKELDLYRLRNQIALKGYGLNKVDIYGRGWPDGISKEDSRSDNRVQRKGEILSNYHFNLCFENTNYPYYCTEKIWESIKYGCLPIYYGKENKIYEDFSKESFLDYCDFNDTEALLTYIDNMSVSEFVDRMNACIKVFNKVYEKVATYSSRETVLNPDMLMRIVCKVQSIIS
ncbi:glycosyl transferase [Nostocales cyanobacterium LEGE 11386]|nr:glycosyl transferase [Nostocales cyanobacterium LEGE 11386]